MRAEEIHAHLKSFAGLPVVRFPEDGSPAKINALPAEVEQYAWRVATDGWNAKESIADRFARFLEHVDSSRVRALVIGSWVTKDDYDTPADFVAELLLTHADRFPALRALFFGDISPRDQEISWIQQADITPLLAAFPDLEEFGVKGGGQLRVEPIAMERLRWLSIRSGGLSKEVVRAVAASRLPVLETLELCLGCEEYGGDSTVEDLAGIFAGTGFPALRRLALADAEQADEIAAALAHAPIVAQLKALDLSLGTLGNVGVEALLAGQSLAHLATLELNHNFVLPEVAERLRLALPGVEIDLREDEANEDEDEGVRYVAVAE